MPFYRPSSAFKKKNFKKYLNVEEFQYDSKQQRFGVFSHSTESQRDTIK